MSSEKSITHPSFVNVSFNRRSGNPGVMYGSSLTNHQSYVTLKVARSERVSSNGVDRYFSAMYGDIIEVDLTSSQFAELITTMNIGNGVPGTLRILNKQKVENPPDDLNVEHNRIHSEFKSMASSLAEKCENVKTQVGELLKKKALSVDDRKQIMNLLSAISRDVGSNAPYFLELFEESANKVVSQAKAEIDAFVTHSIVTAGLKASQEGQAHPMLAAMSDDTSEGVD